MAKAIKRETIHAGGIDIGIYTTDFNRRAGRIPLPQALPGRG